MFGKKTQTENVDKAVSRALDYEVTIADMAKRSEKRAWMVAFMAIIMSLILAAGYFFMLPLKQKVPYMIMADAYTGTATVAELRNDFSTNNILTSEAVSISNAVHFLIARESYDLSRIGERDWDTVFSMASPSVANAYRELHNSVLNPNSPGKLYGKKASIRIKILSTTLISDGKGTVPKGATIRFQRSLFDHATGQAKTIDSKIATMEFVYKNNLKMDEQKRVLNPLGFQVIAYRTDSDFASPPPVEVPVTSVPFFQQPQPMAPTAVDPNAVPQALDASGNPLPAQTMPSTLPAPNTQQPAGTPAPATPNPNNQNGAPTR
jgi:type IV secretion system protein VirB8